MITRLIIPVVFACALFFPAGCANKKSSASSDVAAVYDTASLPAATQQAVSDVETLAAIATQAYVDYKAGNIDFAWGIKHGLDAYATIVKTSSDVKAVVKSWGASTPGVETYAATLAEIFDNSNLPPAQKAAAIAKAVQVAAQNIGA